MIPRSQVRKFKMVKALFLVIVAPLVLVHGYLYLQSGSPHPCRAAAKMLLDGGRFDMLAKMSTSPVDCYQTALFGVEPKPKAPAMVDEEPASDPSARKSLRDMIDKKISR